MATEPATTTKPTLHVPPQAEGNGHAAPHDGPPRDGAHGNGAQSKAQPAAAHPAPHDDGVGLPPPVPQPGRFRLAIIAACAIAILIGLFLFGLLPKLREETVLANESQRIKTALPRVAGVHPRQSPALTEVLLPGDVQALEETTVYPRTSGYLKRWLVDIGDEVKAGQLLAVIDTPDVDQQLDKAKATLGQLRAQQLTVEAQLRLAQATLLRYESLDRDNAVAKLEVDQRRADAETAASALAAAKANVVGGQADVDHLTTLQDFSKVYAPFSGTITARSVDVGQLLTSGNGVSQSLFHLAKTDPVRVFVNVPQIYTPGVKAGLEAQLVVREMPGRKFIGKVTRTARAIDPLTRTLLTEIQVPNHDHALLTGSYVQVRMAVAQENPPLLIPAAALIFNADGTHVAILDAEHHVHFQPVQVEGDFGSDVGISSGLKPTDLIVSNPGGRLREGGAVEVDVPKGSSAKE